MADKQVQQVARSLDLQLREIGVRIRRYTLDSRLDEKFLPHLQEAYENWLEVRKDFFKELEKATSESLAGIEHRLLLVDRQVDLVQRSLVSVDSFKAGARTVTLLALALVVLAVVYLLIHGVRGWNFSDFEPLAEWGPLKYVEVAFWSEFGVLCLLLFLAAYYIKRRDFDVWYQPWYVATALRAPFLTVILMVLVLEFVEWYGEDTWIETYLLEEGNKFYFIAFMSFCLGLVSDQAAEVASELAESVIEFVHGVVKKVTGKLKTAIAPDSEIAK
jgi:hypothetical protein